MVGLALERSFSQASNVPKKQGALLNDMSRLAFRARFKLDVEGRCCGPRETEMRTDELPWPYDCA